MTPGDTQGIRCCTSKPESVGNWLLTLPDSLGGLSINERVKRVARMHLRLRQDLHDPIEDYPAHLLKNQVLYEFFRDSRGDWVELALQALHALPRGREHYGRLLRGDQHQGSDDSQLTVVRASDVQVEKPEFLWPGRIVLGKLGVLDGDPDHGKSTITIDLAARVSTGAGMPDGSSGLTEPRDVVLLSAEDAAGDTIVPRLIAAGADLKRVHIVTAASDREVPRAVSLPNDLNEVQALVEANRAVLVVIDPLNAYLDKRVDPYKDHDVRRALYPFAQLADQTGASILCVRHLPKTPPRSAAMAGMGSVGIIGAARWGLIVFADPDTRGRYVLAVTKSNLAKPEDRRSLAYRIVESDYDSDVPRIQWEGEVPYTANALLRRQRETALRLDEAEEFLLDYLSGGPRPALEVYEAASEHGIKRRTLQRAKLRLGVISQRQGFGAGSSSLWMLPPTEGSHHTSPDVSTGLWRGMEESDTSDDELERGLQVIERVLGPVEDLTS